MDYCEFSHQQTTSLQLWSEVHNHSRRHPQFRLRFSSSVPSHAIGRQLSPLHTFAVAYGCIYFNMYAVHRVASSEKVDKWARYCDFQIASMPYPGIPPHTALPIILIHILYHVTCIL